VKRSCKPAAHKQHIVAREHAHECQHRVVVVLLVVGAHAGARAPSSGFMPRHFVHAARPHKPPGCATTACGPDAASSTCAIGTFSIQGAACGVNHQKKVSRRERSANIASSPALSRPAPQKALHVP
jgi:hypothetical protein